MKPGAFEYVRPASVAEGLAVLADRGVDTSVLAGGQSLVPLLNMRLARPEVLLDVNRLPELTEIRQADGILRIGATVRATTVQASPETLVGELLPAAVRHIGHPQIRARTTVGGSVAHADPSSELPCVLACVDGSVRLASSRGVREVGWAEFLVGTFQTSREPDELLVEVRFPTLPGWRFRFVEFARRHGDFPIVALAVGLLVEGDTAAGLRVAVGGVASRPVRLDVVEKAARGRSLDASLVTELADAARDGLDPRGDAVGSGEYRRHLAGTLLSRALTELIEEARR